jgi:hypothetical protein
MKRIKRCGFIENKECTGSKYLKYVYLNIGSSQRKYGLPLN